MGWYPLVQRSLQSLGSFQKSKQVYKNHYQELKWACILPNPHALFISSRFNFSKTISLPELIDFISSCVDFGIHHMQGKQGTDLRKPVPRRLTNGPGIIKLGVPYLRCGT